jgi:polar amino acid transport system substrate-binding protein
MGHRSKALTMFHIAFACCSGSAQALELLTEENPPLNFTREGKPAGVATMMVSEMARRAGVPAEIRVLAWREAFERARDGTDACVYSTVRNAPRFELFQWVGPIARGEYSAFALERFSEKARRVDDLKQFRIGVANDARADYLRARGFQKVYTFDDNGEIPKHLSVGGSKPNGMDLWVTQAHSAYRVARQAGVNDLKLVFAGILTQDYWLACGKKVPTEIVGKLSEALSSMHKDGATKTIQTAEPVETR